MDRLRAINYFLSVAETGSFSGAAKVLGVPASSVSRRVKDLESELGATLFHRSTRLVKLTEIGALYREQVTPAIEALENANEVIKQHSTGPSGLLRITAGPGFGRFKVIPALAKFRQKYPEVVVDIELTDRVVNLASNQVDIAIRATASLPERLVARKISNNDFVLVASPVYLEKQGVPSTLQQLESCDALKYRGPDSVLHWQAKCGDSWRELSTNTVYVSNEGEALLNEALAGNGVALLPEWSVRDHLKTRALVEIKLIDACVSISRSESSGVYLLYHQPKYSLHKVKAAVDFLLDELAD